MTEAMETSRTPIDPAAAVVAARVANMRSVRTETSAHGVVHVVLDVPGVADNALDAGTIEELASAIEALSSDDAVHAIVLGSAKKGAFCAGLDPAMWLRIRSVDEIGAMVDDGHALCARIARSRVPVVALIDGVCAGAGLAIALACRARVGTRDRRTTLAAYEPGLAMVPLFGSCARLLEVAGATAASEVLGASRALGAERSRKLGLLDVVVPRSAARLEAEARALSLASGTNERGRAERGWPRAWMEGTALGRRVVARRARAKAQSSALDEIGRAHARGLDVLEAAVAHGDDRARALERAAVIELSGATEVRGASGIALARRRAESERGLPDRPEVAARRVERVGVLGATRAGCAIAAAAAGVARLPVRLWDRDDVRIGAGLADARRRMDEMSGRRLSAREKDAAMARIGATVDGRGMRGCDVAIECVFDDRAAKSEALRAIESVVRDETIIATTTASVALDLLASDCARPERIVGLRPAWTTGGRLVEVDATGTTDPVAVATCLDLVRRLGFAPIVVRDGSRSYVRRIVAPYVDEAAYLLADGARAHEIDDALEQIGFALGPIAMLDAVDLDVATRAALIVQEHAARTRAANDDRLGRWLGALRPGAVSRGTITQRCVLAVVNEAARALGEGVLRDAQDGDLGAVLGLGFPRGLGGPFRWVDESGAATVVDWLEGLAASHGDRFAPAPLLVALAKSGRRF
ncbi:MAG: enoyl-CoA hydratase/isomerase family protein, partial [Deltaproteobacteria bacterium]|nr:enoyl-CoA hydratase/isomerase family protein [Deltaproteobacteria bacterium]